MAIDRNKENTLLKKVIEEELGISAEVKLLCHNLVEKVAEEYSPGYNLKVVPFSKECGEYTIYFNLCDYPDRRAAENSNAEFKGITFFSKHKIEISGFTIKGKIPKDRLGEVLQHEFKHIFDLYKSGRTGFFKTTDEGEVYRTAATHAVAKNLPKELRSIGYAVYLSYTFESQAFESGVYAYLMKQNLSFIGDEIEAVKSTMYYRRLMFVRYAYDFVIKNKDRAEDIANTFYGKTYDWLKKTVSFALKITRRQIGRAVAKVREDYDWTHGGTTLIWT